MVAAYRAGRPHLRRAAAAFLVFCGFVTPLPLRLSFVQRLGLLFGAFLLAPLPVYGHGGRYRVRWKRMPMLVE